MARPQIEIDKERFEEMCALQCTEEDIANEFNCDRTTIYRWCKREYGESFATVFDKKRARGKTSLRRTLFEMAKKYPAVAIFLAKNLLGYTDKVEETVKSEELPKFEVHFVEGAKDGNAD